MTAYKQIETIVKNIVSIACRNFETAGCGVVAKPSKNYLGCQMSHSYRLWISSDKYICGDCGKFVYKRSRNIKDFVFFLRIKFSKSCLSCGVIATNKKRNEITSQGVIYKLKYNHSLFCKN